MHGFVPPTAELMGGMSIHLTIYHDAKDSLGFRRARDTCQIGRNWIVDAAGEG